MHNVADLGRECIDTGCNTLTDTLALAPATPRRSDHVPDGRFGLASLHRYENIFRRERFASLLDVVESFADGVKLLFILHPPTSRQLDQLGLRERMLSNPGIELRPRYTYFDFVSLLERAEFVLTDGGSVQEESSYLGVPCLLLRAATERREGLGANVVLSNYDPAVIEAFREQPGVYRSPRVASVVAPSDLIVDSALAHSGGRETPEP
jgi:UDP-N-acetylglucosamine 2-epimerase (non-hydrolysing)